MPTYSGIEIEFLVDLVEDSDLKLATAISGVVTPQTWIWVNTRSGAFEVTEGTPTGTAGETTASNFKLAFDTDNPTGYTIVTSTNTITIQSETLGQDFVGLQIDDENGITLIDGTDYNVTFTNYEAPFDVSTINGMLARSPYYVNTPFYFDTTTKATIGLKIYEGDFTADEPSTDTQVIDKVRPTIDYAEFNTNISNLVSNYLQSEPNIPLTSASYVVAANDGETVWTRYTASYTDAVETTSDVTGYLAASNGYTEFLNGVNYSYDGYLTSAILRSVAYDGVILLPILNNGYYNDVAISSIPTNENGVNTVVFTTSNESTDFVQYVQVDVSQFTTDTTIRLALDKAAGGKDTIE